MHPPLGLVHSLILFLTSFLEHCLATIEYASFCEYSQGPGERQRTHEGIGRRLVACPGGWHLRTVVSLGLAEVSVRWNNGI